MMKKSILTQVLFFSIFISITNIANAYSEQSSTVSQDNDKYVTLTCVVENEIEPTSERRYQFVAETTNNESGEKGIRMIYSKYLSKDNLNQDMYNFIQKGDTIILKIEKDSNQYKNISTDGFFIGFEHIQSINGFKLMVGISN